MNIRKKIITRVVKLGNDRDTNKMATLLANKLAPEMHPGRPEGPVETCSFVENGVVFLNNIDDETKESEAVKDELNNILFIGHTDGDKIAGLDAKTFVKRFNEAFTGGRKSTFQSKDRNSVVDLYFIGCEVGLSDQGLNNSMAQQLADTFYKAYFENVRIHAVSYEQSRQDEAFTVGVIDRNSAFRTENNRGKLEAQVVRGSEDKTPISIFTPEHPITVLDRIENTFIPNETYAARMQRLNKDTEYQKRKTEFEANLAKHENQKEERELKTEICNKLTQESVKLRISNGEKAAFFAGFSHTLSGKLENWKNIQKWPDILKEYRNNYVSKFTTGSLFGRRNKRVAQLANDPSYTFLLNFIKESTAAIQAFQSGQSPSKPREAAEEHKEVPPQQRSSRQPEQPSGQRSQQDAQQRAEQQSTNNGLFRRPSPAKAQATAENDGADQLAAYKGAITLLIGALNKEIEALRERAAQSCWPTCSPFINFELKTKDKKLKCLTALKDQTSLTALKELAVEYTKDQKHKRVMHSWKTTRTRDLLNNITKGEEPPRQIQSQIKRA